MAIKKYWWSGIGVITFHSLKRRPSRLQLDFRVSNDNKKKLKKKITTRLNTRIFQSKIACWSQYNLTQIAKDSQNGLTFIDTLNNLKNLILINCHYCHYNWVFLQQVGYIISHSDRNSIQIHLPNFPTMAIETNSRMKQHGIFLHG